MADAGPMDLLTHMAHVPGFPRHPILRAGTERFGGKLTVWGTSTPRPPEWLLKLWPYEETDLARRFNAVEADCPRPPTWTATTTPTRP